METKLNRIKLSILLVLYQQYPLKLSEDEIINKIEKLKLLEMSEKEFNLFNKEINLKIKN